MNFADLPEPYGRFDQSAIALLPVPYDGTSTWIKGADMGPCALMCASPTLELYDIETGTEVYRRGIYTDAAIVEKSSPEAMVDKVHRRAGELLDHGKFVVTVGGEHSVSIGAVRAFADRHPDLTVLQLDAHSDLREEFRGSRYNHACVMKRVLERCPIVQVGIRSMIAAEIPSMVPGSVFFAERIHGQPADQWMPQVISRLGSKVYITIDLDVFDPAFIPSTGTPEPGGMGWYTVLELLRRVTEARTVVGFDVVELCPNEENKGPDFAAAKLVYKLLSYVFRSGAPVQPAP
jgi:agmatinase